MAGSLLGSSALLFLCVLCSPLNAQNDCGPPPRREKEELADLTVKESYSHNEYVLYNCRPGYIKVGRFRLKCNNGRWHETPPYIDCRKKPCGHPGDIQSGSFELVEGEDFSFGARVEYRCEEGYKMLSHTNYRECRADGWSNDVPHCEITKCFPVREPKNGRILMTGIMDLNQDFPYGHLLQFECNDRFKIKGSNQIVCTSDGTWSAEVPTCVEITCEPPNIDHGGVRNSKTIYRNGERIQIYCNDGYKSAERDEATCTQDGWNTRVECIAIVCRQPQIDNGNIRPKLLLYQYQDSIDTSCEEGYRNTDTSFCTARGWQPPPACIPKHCEYPNVQNGRVYEWRSSFPKRPGSTFYFGCNNGFLPEDKSTDTWHLSYCTIRGWEPEPKCFKQCDSPRRIPHGSFNYYRGPLIEGNVISYRCDTGYVPANQQTTITCTKNGWLPTPSCVAQVLEIPRECRKTPLPNGFFIAHKEVFSVSEKVSYKCRNGYITPNRVEEEEIQCLQTGWNQEPKCIKTCQKPNEANVDFVEKESFFLSQETLHYTCKEGFQVSKTAVDGHIQCTENGWDSMPACVAIECDVPNVENGNIEGKDQFANGDVVKFSCKKGYSRVGPDSAQCYYFGWSPQPPVCKETVKSCQQPLSISNGTVVGDPLEEYQHGKKLFYECDIGFVMSGSNTVECVDGEWTSLPSCKEEVNFCGKPPQIRNGRTVGVDSNSDRYRHNETVKYECSPTFFLVGTNPARCLHGEWKTPECSKQCKKPEDIKFVPRSVYFNNNTVVNYICGVNRHPTMCVNGKWFPEPECTELCPPPPQLPNAINVTETRNYKNGEEVGFTCMEHFLLQEPLKISCENGRWQTPPRCIDQRCENPPSIDNGEVVNISQNKYLPGETVEYHCLEGFEISGPSFATCGNAKWQKLPVCKEKTCGQRPLIDHASYLNNGKNKYQSGETVNYECHPGFAAEGPLILTCQRGEWSEPSTCEDVTCREPHVIANGDIVENRDNIVVNRENIYLPGQVLRYQCHKDFEIIGPNTITCKNRTWSEPPRCEDVSCSPPLDILHGRLQGNIKPNYSPNEIVQYRCDRGYVMFGSRTITCLKKQWSKAPQCRVDTGKCGRPPVIENGDIIVFAKEEYKSGEHVTYKCQSYYIMEGNAEVRCQDGHWSDTPKCIVPCTASEEDMEHNNIRLRWSREGKLYSKDGDVTEFTCKWGYNPAVPPSQFRVQCVNGTFEYPQCM